MNFHETFDPSRETIQGETATCMAGHASTSRDPLAFEENHGRTVTNKRSRSTMESDASLPVSASARSVAIDLGMLSLQSDSRQKHYLGSSSGLLFTKLMGLDNASSPAQSTSSTRLLAPLRVSDEIYRALYSQLQRVRIGQTKKSHSHIYLTPLTHILCLGDPCPRGCLCSA